MGNIISTNNKVKDIGSITSVSPADNIILTTPSSPISSSSSNKQKTSSIKSKDKTSQQLSSNNNNIINNNLSEYPVPYNNNNDDNINDNINDKNDDYNNDKNETKEVINISTKSVNRSKVILVRTTSKDSINSTSSKDMISEKSVNIRGSDLVFDKVEQKIGKCEVISILGVELTEMIMDKFDENMMIPVEVLNSFINEWNDVFISYTVDGYQLAKSIADFLSQKGLSVILPTGVDGNNDQSHKEMINRSKSVIGVINNQYIADVYAEPEPEQQVEGSGAGGDTNITTTDNNNNNDNDNNNNNNDNNNNENNNNNNEETPQNIVKNVTMNATQGAVSCIEDTRSKRTLCCIGVVDGPYLMDAYSCGDRLMNIYESRSVKATDDYYLDEVFFKVMKALKKSVKTVKKQLSEINHDKPESRFLPIYLNLPETFTFDDKYIVSSSTYRLSSTSIVFYGHQKGNRKSYSDDSVVVKFMKNRIDFDKEISIRESVSKECFMEVLAVYESHEYDVLFKQFGLGSFPHALIIKKATKTLDSVILNEIGTSSPDWDRLKPIALQIVRTLSRLHDRGYLLGNIDPTNIMCYEDNIKFIDLKCCTKANDEEALCRFYHNTAYLAPEVFTNAEGGLVRINPPPVGCLSMDIWSLGCVLFELFTGESLFHCNSNLSLADPSQLATFSSPFLKKKLKKINSYKARELLMLMLEKHPSSRTDIGRVFSHSFFTDNKALSNVLNHSQQFDVFLSYRHFSDNAVADTIYTFLVSEGFSVYVDKVYNPNMSWYENVSYGLKNSRIFLPVVSRAAILNFGTITADSPADALLIQYRVAMEYKALNFIQDVVSVFVGDRDWSSGSYGNFLLQQCFPVFPDVVCKALEEIIACDVHIPDSSQKSLKQTCTSLFSLDSTYSMREGWESKTVVCQGQVDSCMQDLKMKVVTTIAQLEEKECSDMSDDLLKKIKEISSLGFTITDKDGNKIKYDYL